MECGCAVSMYCKPCYALNTDHIVWTNTVLVVLHDVVVRTSMKATLSTAVTTLVPLTPPYMALWLVTSCSHATFYIRLHPLTLYQVNFAMVMGNNLAARTSIQAVYKEKRSVHTFERNDGTSLLHLSRLGRDIQE